MSRRNSRSRSNSADGAGAALLAIALLLMPFFGLFLTFKGRSESDKLLGMFLLGLGTVIYLVAAFQ